MKECPTCHRCFADHLNHCGEDGALLVSTIAGDTVLEARYELKKRLGQGGMGAVYEARHIFLKTVHAIKIILPEFLVSNDPEFVRRFRQEAMAAANIRHRNVIRVTDYGVTNGIMPFLVMDFIRGRLLQEILSQEKRVSPERSLELMEPIMAGVGAAHRLGIVHRDLKPLNIMIEDELPLRDAVKVLDFGLAKIKAGELLGSFAAAKSSGVMGSPPYMAPEQWSDEEFDSRTDIYSLGIILYQMLTGAVPFKGPSAPSIMKKHLMDEPPRFAESGVFVPPQVEAVVRHSLEKSPANRPQSVDEFISELRAAINKAATDHERTQSSPPTFLLDTFIPGSVEAQIAHSHTFDDSETLPRDSGAEQRLREAEAAARQAEEAAARAAEEERRRKEEELRAREEEERRAAAHAAELERLRLEEEHRRQMEEEEAARKRAEEEREAAEEEERKRAAEEQERQREAVEATARVAEEERLRKEKERREREIEAARRDEEERRQKEEERKLAEEAERQRQEEEARQRAAEEAERQRQEEEARQKAAEEERRRQEAERKRLAEEAERRAAEHQRRLELERVAAEEEKRRAAARAAELERLRLEEEARRRAEAAEAQKRALEEARRRAEEEEILRKAEEAERLAKESSRAEEEERRLRAEEDRRVEEAARKRVEEQATRRRAEEERKRAAEEQARRREAEEEAARAAEEERMRQEDEARKRAEEEAEPEEFIKTIEVRRGVEAPTVLPPVHLNYETKKSRVRVITLAAVATLIGITGILYLLFSSRGQRVSPANSGSDNGTLATANVNVSSSNQADSSSSGKQSYRAELVAIPGGKFLMGRNDVSKTDAVALLQYPAHEVDIKPFLIDRTEVTNAEYADFVRETRYKPPEDWQGDIPPAGKELLPVVNVSFQDVQAFAIWRSKRDGVAYRLPREDEWEFVARGAGNFLYPWGNEWTEDRVNLDGEGPRPVGSYPQGASVADVLDMIGNVWEWTSSEASLYRGNDKLDPVEKGWIVVRGGSYRSMSGEAVKKRGGKAFPATWREWLKKDTRNPTLGFRLVRDLP